MRRLAFLVVGGAVWLLLGAVPASADNGPHLSTQGMITDRCAGCHRLHSGQAPYLLREEEPALCYTCHGSAGTGSALSVQNGIAYSSASDRTTPAGALRGGGFEYALLGTPLKADGTGSGVTTAIFTQITVAGSQQASASSHSMNGTAQTAWGNGAFSASSNTGSSVNLTCTSCHDPHGGADGGTPTFRILTPNPNAYSSTQRGYAANCTPTGVDVSATDDYNLTTSSDLEGACTYTSGANTGYCYVRAPSYSSTSNVTTWTANCTSSLFPTVGSVLVETGNTTGSYTGLTPPLPPALTIPKPNIQPVPDVGSKDYTTSDYWSDIVDPALTYALGNVTDTTTNVMAQSAAGLFSARMANWCSQCHTRYKATSGQTYRYNTGDAVFAYRHRADAPLGQTAGTAGFRARPTCIQCHVAHGSNAVATGVAQIENPGGGTAGLTGLTDNRNLRADNRGVCQFCHNR